MSDLDPTRDFVLRALAASEIAESCNRADLRQSFSALAENWLLRGANSCLPANDAEPRIH